MPDLNDVYHRLGTLEGAVTESTKSIHEKVDKLHDAMKAHVEKDADDHAKHGARIRSLEQSRAKLLGMAAGAAAVVSSGVAYLTKLFTP